MKLQPLPCSVAPSLPVTFAVLCLSTCPSLRRLLSGTSGLLLPTNNLRQGRGNFLQSRKVETLVVDNNG